MYINVILFLKIIVFSVLFLQTNVFADSSWETNTKDIFNELKDNRKIILSELSKPIVDCLDKKDTNHIIFNGCVDWHSSVHAMWSLVVFEDLMDNSRIATQFSNKFNIDNINLEREFLKSNPKFEMPYGRAWLLRLAIDYDRTFNDELFIVFADEIANSLKKYYMQNPPKLNSNSYKSSSWALINLRHYAKYRNQLSLLTWVDEYSKMLIHSINEPCDVEDETHGFMAICTNLAWLAGEVITNNHDYKAWLTGFIPDPTIIKPIKFPTTAHEYGLNFSRSWGLWEIYKKTKDTRYADLYSKHFMQTYLNKEHWKGDYRVVGHWVAQFGIYALTPLFEDYER